MMMFSCLRWGEKREERGVESEELSIVDGRLTFLGVVFVVEARGGEQGEFVGPIFIAERTFYFIFHFFSNCPKVSIAQQN